jgi:prepilin-type N-terminal cleavage/methylation domain-containing protein
VTRDRRPARLFDQRGLTLVEILLAVAIVGVALAGLGVVVPVATYGVHDGNQLSTATFLAEQMIERTRAAAWTASPPVDCLGTSSGDLPPVPTGATCRDAVATQFPDEPGVGGHPQYRRTVRVTSCATIPCAGVATAGMRLVEVTVAYAPIPGAGSVSAGPRTVRLAWLVAQK